MNDVTGTHDESSSNTWKWIVLLLSVLYIVGSLYFLFDLRTRVTALSSDQDASKQQLADLSKRIQATDTKAEAQSEALAQQRDLRPALPHRRRQGVPGKAGAKNQAIR